MAVHTIWLSDLHRMQAEHPFWDCALVAGFRDGAFSVYDLRYIYSQYHLYSKNFTRFIAAVMANCENDLFRAQLSENLWEEGGGCEPDRRHAQIFRNFLQKGLGVGKPEQLAYEPFAQHFVREYLVYCLRSEPVQGAAFLSLGTEGIVKRLYETMLVGLRKAGVAEEHLEFFHLHISCDDEHAVTLENMMTSYATRPGWFDVCASAMNKALELRMEFFDHIFDALHKRRLEPILGRMQGRESLAMGLPDAALCHRQGDSVQELYRNEVAKLDMKFAVDRLPLAGEVLDPRIVHIPPGKNNEKHKHAHETLIHILAGSAVIVIDDRQYAVKVGDTVLVPRWAMHQTRNVGGQELKFLAVTDFNLSQRAFVGDATDYRQGQDADARRVAARR